MGFPKQEYWSRLPFPTPGDLPDPGIEPASVAWKVDSLPQDHTTLIYFVKMPALSLLILLIYTFIAYSRNFPVAYTSKNLLAMQETWVRFLGQKDPLEKGLAIHSSILAWRIPQIEEPEGLQFVGSQRVRHD